MIWLGDVERMGEEQLSRRVYGMDVDDEREKVIACTKSTLLDYMS